jgi:repressor of nif and glnA expression
MRFTEVIYYNGSSVDPSEIFIKAKMTSVHDAALDGNGKIRPIFEIPALCEPVTRNVIQKLKQAKVNGVLII